MAEHRKLYERAVYYDIALDGDVSREVEFMLAAYERHAGRPVRSVLELACGPAYHARAMAARGLRVVGLDLSADMIALAADKAAAEAVEVAWVVADMRDFRLPAPVDMAVCTLDGIDGLLTDAEIVRHLHAVAANLAPGGIYLIELSHPRRCSPEAYGRFRYHGERNGCSVTIDWPTSIARAGSGSRVVTVEVRMTVKRDGAQETFVDCAPERFLSVDEVVELTERSGVFAIRGWYGDFSLDCPLDHGEAARMIVVLQKRAGDGRG